MSTLGEIKTKNRKFKKRSYRTWDIGGEGIDGSTSKKDSQSIIADQIIVKKEEEKGIVLTKPKDKPKSKLKSKPKQKNEKKEVEVRGEVSSDETKFENKKESLKPLDTNKQTFISSANGNFIKASILQLTGIQKNIFTKISDECINNKENNTVLIYKKNLVDISGCHYEAAKTSLKRLVTKGLLVRLKGKPAKGGFINIELPSEVQSIYLDLIEKSQFDIKF